MATTTWLAGSTELSLGPGNLYIAPTNTAETDWDTATYTALGGCSSAVLRDISAWTELKEAQLGDGYADKVLTADNSEIEYAMTRPYVERMEDIINGFYVNYKTDGVTVEQVSRHRKIGKRLSAAKMWFLFKAFDANGNESTNKLEWRYWLASPYQETVELTFDATTQRTYPVMAAAFECADIQDPQGNSALWWSGVVV